jgi:hypothetical protein
MPLDARKTLHLLQVVARSFTGRQRTVVGVYLSSGSYSYAAMQVIMRPAQVIDLQVLDISSQSLPHNADTVMIAPLGTNFTGAVYIADTTSATAVAVASAAKYEIIEVLPVGIVPGGSHLRLISPPVSRNASKMFCNVYIAGCVCWNNASLCSQLLINPKI